MSKKSKVLVIGLDSMEKDLILEWAQDGAMPNFKRLMESAAWGLVQNPTGLVSGGSWSSFYNGVKPDKHGQYDAYDYFDTEKYRYATYTKSNLSYSPIWEVLGRQGKRFVVIDAPYSFLAENYDGIHVMDWTGHVRLHGGMTRTWPPELAREIETRFGQDPLGVDVGSPCDQEPPRTAAEYAAFRDKLLDRMARKAELSIALLKREEWSFFFTVFCETHCVGHHCWHLHDRHHALHNEEVRHAVGDPVKDVYIGIDGALGRILAEVDTDTTVLVYSSFGMGPHYSGTDLLDLILLRLDGKEVSESKEQITDLLRQVWRRAPTKLRNSLMGLRKNVWEPFYQSKIVTDKSARRFFEMKTNNATGGVRINLVGRESHGVVRPGAEFDRICEELASDLLAIKNCDSGEPLVHEVIRTDRIYQGKQLDKLPDLLVQWNRSAPIVHVTSSKTGDIENRHLNVRTGDHKPFGLFLATGPSVTPGKVDGAIPVTDFAPTIATLLGADLPTVDGQPISRLV